MNERDIFDEKSEVKKATFSCPFCRERHEYDVRWLKRTKKKSSPRHLNQQDQARFQNSRDYMIRVDDAVTCKTCGKKFDIPSQHSMVFIEHGVTSPGPAQLQGGGDEDSRFNR